MLTRFAIGLAWLLHLLPLPLLNLLGQWAGILFLRFGRERRTVTFANLRLCFPLMSDLERRELMRQHYRAFGRAVVESTICWWGTKSRIRRLVKVEGEENLKALKGKRFIFFAPHFCGIEQATMRLALDHTMTVIYVHQKNQVFDKFLSRRRLRFGEGRLLSRQEGVKPMIRAVRDGLALQLSPDLDLGPKESIFVPFFGMPAATVTALPRLAALCDAHIVPVVVTQLPGWRGYKLRIYPAWENYPTDDVEADVRHMNAFIEERILEQPEHYMWMHKRFKTRMPVARNE